MKVITRERFLEIISELAKESGCTCTGYCFFRRLIECQKPSVRMLIQFDAIQKFKFEESERAANDVGDHDAGQKWVESGLAKRFAEVFDEDLSVKEIYRRTLEVYDVKTGKVKENKT